MRWVSLVELHNANASHEHRTNRVPAVYIYMELLLYSIMLELQ
jgi:hypothetical protein